jgi:hypothetical protein
MRADDAPIGMGRVLSKEAFAAKFGSVPDLPSSAFRGSSMPDLQELMQELSEARQEVKNLTVMGIRPDPQPHEAELARNLERHARVKVKLALKAIQHERSK